MGISMIFYIVLAIILLSIISITHSFILPIIFVGIILVVVRLATKNKSNGFVSSDGSTDYDGSIPYDSGSDNSSHHCADTSSSYDSSCDSGGSSHGD